MPDDPIVELARHGDLRLVRPETMTDRVGLLRDEYGHPSPKPAVTFDRAEWHWLLVCAAPLALDVLGPEPDARPEQTALSADARSCAR